MMGKAIFSDEFKRGAVVQSTARGYSSKRPISSPRHTFGYTVKPEFTPQLAGGGEN